jgi:DNA invertase Pin-like site-specific DNA recombinase
VSAGIRNARAKGMKFGRPMRAVDPDRILQMRSEGQSQRQIAEKLGVGYGTVRERLKGGERKTPRKTDREKPQIKDT